MVSPWDSQRQRPGSWISSDPPQSDRSGTPEPPSVGGDFPLPPHPTQPPEPDWPEITSDERRPDGELDSRRRGRVSTSDKKVRTASGPRIPVALGAVSLLVALLVFVGLRVVRFNVSNVGDSPTAVDQGVPGESGAAQAVPGQEPPSEVTTTISQGANPTNPTANEVDWNEIARSVVYFEVAGGCQWVGSGTLILDGSYVLTNWHVSGGGECPLRVGLTESPSRPPAEFFPATVVVWDSQIDLAIVRLQSSTGAPFVPPGRKPVKIAESEARLGDAVKLLGYPVVREDQFDTGERYTLTLTDGSVSGTEDFGERPGYNPTDSRSNDYEVWGEYIKHTAKQNGGVSGGGAFNSKGELVAIPTAGGEKLELMRSVRFAKVLIDQMSK